MKKTKKQKGRKRTGKDRCQGQGGQQYQMAEGPTKIRTENRPLDLVPWEVICDLLLSNFRTKHFRE